MIKVCTFVLMAMSFIMGITGISAAMDPSGFYVILGVSVYKNSDTRDPFADIKKKLGNARRIDKGDASTYEGRIEYILGDRSQSLVFLTGECFRGYVLEYCERKSDLSSGTVLDRSISKIETCGAALGMTKREIAKIFGGKIPGGWKLEKYSAGPNAQHFSYMKDNKYDGMDYCDHISINLFFDAQSKLTKLTVSVFDCDDSSCGG